MKARHWTNSLPILCFFLVYWALASFFPLTGDDWYWGVRSGISNLNGRYAANLLATYLPQIDWLRPLFMAAVMTTLVWAAAKLGSQRFAPKFVLSAVMFLSLSIFIIRQAVVWTAGFSTYCVPTAILLCVVLLYQKSATASGKLKWLCWAACITLTLLLQLFVENLTLYCAAMIVIVLAVELFNRHKGKPWNALILPLAGIVLVGAVLMFSHDAYKSTDNNEAHDMPRADQILENIEGNYFDKIVPDGFAVNTLLNAAATILLVFALCKTMPSMKPKKRRFATVLSVLLPLVNIYFFVRKTNPQMPRPEIFRLTDGFLAAAFLLLCFVGAWLLPRGRHRIIMLFSIASIVMLAAPLLPTIPIIGDRCYFTFCAFLIVFCHAALGFLQENDWLKIKTSVVAPILICTLCGLFTMLFSAYITIDRAAEARQVSIQQQLAAGNTTITVRKLPLTNYVWAPDPNRKYSRGIFISFYNLPENITIKLVK